MLKVAERTTPNYNKSKSEEKFFFFLCAFNTFIVTR